MRHFFRRRFPNTKPRREHDNNTVSQDTQSTHNIVHTDPSMCTKPTTDVDNHHTTTDSSGSCD